MADELELVTIEGVELVATGHWAASTGEIDITKADLEAMIEASQDPALRDAVVKLGHNSKINKQLGDAMPALGWVTNLRLNENGTVLLGDLVSVPKSLAALIVGTEDEPAPYRSRSVEIDWGVTTQTGNKHPAYLSGLALLGEYEPAVEGLDDIVKLFTAAAGSPRHRTLLAAQTVDTIRQAYVQEVPEADRPEPYTWVREIWLDEGSQGYMILEGEDTGQLYRLTWQITADGVAFGQAEQVEVEYVGAGGDGTSNIDVTPPEQRTVPAEAKHAVLLARLHVNDATHAARSVTVTQAANQEVDVEISKLAEALKLEGDATDEKVMEAITALAARAAAADDLEARVAELEKQGQTQPDPDAEGKVTITPEALAALQAQAAAGAEAAKELADEKREKVLADALSKGRITPAVKGDWATALEKDFDGTKTLLEALPEQGAMPTTHMGHAQGDDPTMDAELDQLNKEFMGLGGSIIADPATTQGGE